MRVGTHHMEAESAEGTVNGRRLTDPARYDIIIDGRPQWHMCCYGDTGGWRTHLCDWMEHKWRNTEYYKEPRTMRNGDETGALHE